MLIHNEKYFYDIYIFFYVTSHQHDYFTVFFAVPFYVRPSYCVRFFTLQSYELPNLYVGTAVPRLP